MAQKSDIFQDPTKTVPKSDPRIVRVPFDQEELGARSSHIAGIHKRNDMDVKHVKEGQ
jgi:hypothetical protein